jgi:spore germination protein
VDKTTGKMTLTSFQATSVLVGIIVGIGLLFVSRISVHYVGRGAWLAVFLAGLVVILNGWIMIKLAGRFPQQTIVEYVQVIFGKWLGICIGFILILLSLIMTIFTLWFTGQIITAFVLFATPSYIVMLSLMLLTIYTAYAGMNAVGRMNEIIFIVSFGFAIFFIPPVVEYGNFSFIRPIIQPPNLHFLSGIPLLLFCYTGYELVLSFYPFVKESEKHKMLKHMSLNMIYVCVIATIAVITQQIVFPIHALERIWLPSIQYVKLVSLPILERTDLVFTLFWFFVFYKAHTVYFYRSVIESQLLFKLRTDKWLILVFAALISIVTFFQFELQDMERWMLYTMQVTAFIYIFLPITALLLSKLRGKGNE